MLLFFFGVVVSPILDSISPSSSSESTSTYRALGTAKTTHTHQDASHSILVGNPGPYGTVTGFWGITMTSHTETNQKTPPSGSAQIRYFYKIFKRWRTGLIAHDTPQPPIGGTQHVLNHFASDPTYDEDEC